MPRPSPRPPGRCRRLPAIALALLTLAVLAACGGSTDTTGHDTPQGAVHGFFDALGSFDGSPGALQQILNWVPPSRRQGSAQDFAVLVGGATRIRFKLDTLTVGDARTQGDSATVGVQGRLMICASGSVGTDSFDSCQPAPITPGGRFDVVTCVREQGQWFVADYSDSAVRSSQSPGAASGTSSGGSGTPGASAGAGTGTASSATSASTP